MNECTSNSFNSDVSNKNGFSPMGETVDAGQNVGIVLRWWEWAHNVNMHLIKCIWSCECGKLCLYMSLNFSMIDKTVPTCAHHYSC